MMLKIYFLDYAKTAGMSGVGILHMPPATEVYPNDIVYFCALMVALLMQMLIIYDYFLNYVAASTYFV